MLPQFGVSVELKAFQKASSAFCANELLLGVQSSSNAIFTFIHQKLESSSFHLDNRVRLVGVRTLQASNSPPPHHQQQNRHTAASYLLLRK